MKQFYLAISLLVTTLAYAQLTPPAELQSYYTDVDFSATDTALFDDLAIETIAKHTNILTYSQRHNYLYNADEDLANTNNVILIYNGESRGDNEWLSSNNQNPTQTFNTEHVYPQSLIGSTAKGDLHHLRSCDVSINSNRGNMPFASGSGTYGNVGSAWYPGDEWKGDVARMIMYLNLRYNEPFTDVGTLALFLQWNSEDPVSAFEENRQTIITNAQGNRNPFIDNPYLATLIWGGTAAENRWDTLSDENFTKQSVKIYPNPITTSMLTIETTINSNYKIYDVLGKQILSGKLNKRINKINTQTLNKGIYILKLDSENASISKKLIKN